MLSEKRLKRRRVTKSKRWCVRKRNGYDMNKWSDFKKELDLPKEELLLAKVKLELSELIYDLRKSRRMSQKQLGHAIGVSQPYIAKIEDGEENLTIETIVKLLAALNTRLKLKPEKLGKHDSVFQIFKAA